MIALSMLLKTKALISIAVTAQLICVFVFAYAKSRACHDTAHLFESSSVYENVLNLFSVFLMYAQAKLTQIRLLIDSVKALQSRNIFTQNMTEIWGENMIS